MTAAVTAMTSSTLRAINRPARSLSVSAIIDISPLSSPRYVTPINDR